MIYRIQKCPRLEQNSCISLPPYCCSAQKYVDIVPDCKSSCCNLVINLYWSIYSAWSCSECWAEGVCATTAVTYGQISGWTRPRGIISSCDRLLHLYSCAHLLRSSWFTQSFYPIIKCEMGSFNWRERGDNMEMGAKHTHRPDLPTVI